MMYLKCIKEAAREVERLRSGFATALLEWYQHDPVAADVFAADYFETWDEIRELAAKEKVTK